MCARATGCGGGARCLFYFADPVTSSDNTRVHTRAAATGERTLREIVFLADWLAGGYHAALFRRLATSNYATLVESTG